MAATFTPDQLANLAYQQAHPGDDRRYQIIVSCAICVAASYVAVAVRLWARRLARAGFGLDDYTIIAALFFFTIMSTSAILTTTYGMGRHLIYVTNAEGLGITSIFSEAMYNFIVGSTKVSILCFYGRLFPQKWFRICRWVVGSIIVAFCVAQLFTDIFQCTPIQKFWTPTMPGTCIDFWTGALTGTIFNVITDVITLTMPVPLIWNLKVDRRRRLQLVLAFTIGGVACIASIVRGFYTPELFAFDTTWEFVGIIVSTEVELMMFIISACIPTYATLFTRYRNQQSQPSRQSMPSSSFATKRSHGTFALSKDLSIQDNRWSTLHTNDSKEEEADNKRIVITTAISTSSDHDKKEEFELAEAI